MYAKEEDVRKRPEALVIGVPAGEAARWSQVCANLPEVISSVLWSRGSQKPGNFQNEPNTAMYTESQSF